MTDAEKLSVLRTILGINDTSEDALLTVYLDSSAQEILNWKYGYAEEQPDALPSEDDQTQIWAVVAGYSIIGNENQTAGTENGITRQWAHSDMLKYIHENTIPYAGVM